MWCHFHRFYRHCWASLTPYTAHSALTELDLSENLVGTSENLNSVMPDTVTGGEALADLLRSDGCVLSTLKLGTNSACGEFAICAEVNPLLSPLQAGT